VNVYAVAAQESLVDFGTYLQVLQSEVEMIKVADPRELGLQNVEGAVLTGERHLIIDEARKYFTEALAGAARFNTAKGEVNSEEWDWTVDCTFCAMDSANVDRYEPCLTVLLSSERRPERAVTIMDGPFPSIYPWNEDQHLSSLTSAKYTPFARCSTRAEAEHVLATISKAQVQERAEAMWLQMAHYFPGVLDEYSVADKLLSIRAMPRSGSDARLVDVIKVGSRSLRVRAGKIDAVEQAYQLTLAMMEGRA
jgi:hypothetical protein